MNMEYAGKKRGHFSPPKSQATGALDRFYNYLKNQHYCVEGVVLMPEAIKRNPYNCLY